MSVCFKGYVKGFIEEHSRGTQREDTGVRSGMWRSAACLVAAATDKVSLGWQ